MSDYLVTIKVNQTWLDILGQISRNQDGFIWVKVKESESEL